MVGVEPVDAIGQKALLPLRDGGRRDIQLGRDGAIGAAGTQEQHHVCPSHEASGQRLRVRDLLEVGPLGSSQLNLASLKWHTEKTTVPC